MVKVEGMGQEEAAVVAVAVRGGAGNDLPQFSFSMIFHLKGTLSDKAFGSWVYRMGYEVRDRDYGRPVAERVKRYTLTTGYSLAAAISFF